MIYLRLALATLALAALIGIFESSGPVGENPKEGSVAFDAGEYRVTGGGANIWGAQDAFYFVWKRVEGDVTISADVRFLGAGVEAHRKAVLMVRQDLTPGSAYADAAVHGDGLTSLQFRSEAGAPTSELRSAVSAPSMLRLERRGNQFTLLAGNSAETLTPTGPQTVALTGPVYVGIGVCSHNAQVLETAVFSKVSVEQPAKPKRPNYRSKIKVYDLKSHTSATVFEQDGVVEAPNWSRDGSFLLVNTGGSLFRLPLRGEGKGAPQRIPIDASYRCNNDHDLSHDGAKLAFSASSPQSRPSQVYTANADGSEVKLLTPTAPSYFHGWSPDGKWLAFVGERNKQFHIYRVPAAGGDEQQLTAKGDYDDGPEYSPDGKWIYFNSNRSGSWKLWRMPAVGVGVADDLVRQVTSDDKEDWFPHVSPDGKLVVFLSFPPGTKTHDERMEGVMLRLIPAPGKKIKKSKPKVLETFFGGQGSINVNSWSPQSDKFAYVVYEPLPAR
jgi:TolB protein